MIVADVGNTNIVIGIYSGKKIYKLNKFNTKDNNISHKALVKNASKLNKILIERTNSIVGKNTKNSMQSGFYWSSISLINRIIDRIIIQKKFKPTIILTGGIANIFKKEIAFKTYYEPYLTLQGLYLIGQTKYA